MYKNLRHYIETLERSSELTRIKVQCDPVLEIPEIIDRVSKSPGGGKALFFENTGTRFPLIANIYGSDKRIELALGAPLDQIETKIDSFIGAFLSPKDGLSDKLSLLPSLMSMSRWLPVRTKKRGECQEYIYKGADADLGMLPVLKCWPYDGGRFVTLPMVHTIDPETGNVNMGMYRMQIVNENTTGMHWHVHKTGERHYKKYAPAGEKMPVSITLGGDPVYAYCATAPLPDNIDEYILAGFLRNKAVKLVKCITNDLYVPSDCDFVIEGYVDPTEDKFMEGPFGDHTGFYSLEDLYPYFHVTAITHRRDAVYPATLVGVPPQEDAYIARATEKIFFSPAKFAMIPEIEEWYMPSAGVAHNLAVVSIKNEYPGQGFKTASSLWGAGQMMFNKVALICGEGICIRNPKSLASAVRNSNPSTDLLITKGVLDILDHSVARAGVGGKMAVDLTGYATEQPINDSVPVNDDEDYFPEWSVVIVRKEPTEDIDNEGLFNSIAGAKYIVIADTATKRLNPDELLWFCLAQFDPGRDVLIKDNQALFDCRTKVNRGVGYPSEVPNITVSASSTIELVDSRWNEYGISGFAESHSLKYSDLTYGEGARVKLTE